MNRTELNELMTDVLAANGYTHMQQSEYVHAYRKGAFDLSIGTSPYGTGWWLEYKRRTVGGALPVVSCTFSTIPPHEQAITLVLMAAGIIEIHNTEIYLQQAGQPLAQTQTSAA